MNTTYFLNVVAGNVFKTKTTPAIPSKLYIGLSKTAPTASGTGVTEPSSASGYKRIELAGLSVPADGVVTNSGTISFPESVSNWGEISYFVIYDALSGGNLLMYGNIGESRTVETGTVMIIKPGFLRLSVVNPTS